MKIPSNTTNPASGLPHTLLHIHTHPSVEILEIFYSVYNCIFSSIPLVRSLLVLSLSYLLAVQYPSSPAIPMKVIDSTVRLTET